MKLVAALIEKCYAHKSFGVLPQPFVHFAFSRRCSYDSHE